MAFDQDFFPQALAQARSGLGDFLQSAAPKYQQNFATPETGYGGFGRDLGSVMDRLTFGGFEGADVLSKNIASNVAQRFAGATAFRQQVEGQKKQEQQKSEQRQQQRAAAGAGGSPIASPNVPQDIQQLINDAATRYGVDPALVAGVVQQESSFNPQARNRGSGAAGLMALMPSTAAGLGVTNVMDPAQNIDAGTRYLAQQLQAFGGDVTKALAAYNAGPGAVQQYGGVPPYRETQAYVQLVQQHAERFRQSALTEQRRGEQAPAGARAPRGVSQNELGLDAATAAAFCGPAAALEFAQVFGRNPTVIEAMNAAKEVGWNQQRGMAGPQSQVNLLNRLGVPSSMGAVDPTRIAQEVLAGRPVIIDTPDHYFQVVGYNQATQTFTFGDAVGRRAGNVGLSIADLPRLGFGAARTAIYMNAGP